MKWTPISSSSCPPVMEASSRKGGAQQGSAGDASLRLERKTVEKNRRALMKSLFTQLDALLDPHSKQGVMGACERLDGATCYIRDLKWRLARLRERRDSMVSAIPAASSCAAPALPHVEVRDLGSALEVVLVTGRGHRLAFYETVRVLEEEGAEVVNAGFAVVDGRVVHTVHSLASESRTAHHILCITERLKKLVHEFGGSL